MTTALVDAAEPAVTPGGLTVTVSGPRDEAELTLPDDVPIGRLLPALALTYAGAPAGQVAVVVRPLGALDPAATLAGAGVAAGAVLNLFPIEHLPPAWRATEPPAAPPAAQTAPPQRDPLPLRPADGGAAPGGPAGGCAWLGAHGGAGTSTLAAALGGADLGAYRPPLAHVPGTCPVLVVVRAHAGGLLSAQRLAASELAPGTGPLAGSVVGLVIVADAPGARPKALRDLARLVSGGYPHHQFVPWIGGYRVGEDARRHLPRSLRALVAAVAATRPPA